MQLNLSIILDRLQDVCQGISCHGSLTERPISTFKPYVDEDFSEGVLYLIVQGTPEEVAAERARENLNVLYLGDKPRRLVQSGDNVLWADPAADVRRLTNRIIDVFGHYSSLEAGLKDALLRDDDITDITLAASGFFDKQVVFWDSIGRFASTGANNPHSEDSLAHTTEIESVISTSAKYANARSPFLLSLDTGNCLCRNIFFGKDRMGTIAVEGQGSFTNGEIALLDYVGDTLSHGMRHLKYETTSGDNSILNAAWKLLKGEQVSSGQLTDMLFRFGWAHDDSYRCVVVDVDDDDIFSSELTSPLTVLEKRISHISNRVLTMVDGNHRLVIIGNEGAPDDSRYFVRTVESILLSLNLLAHVGVGDCWSSIRGVDKSFWQANQALEYGLRFQPEMISCWFVDYMLLSAVETLRKSVGNGSVFAPHAIEVLRQHDRENGGKLLETLQCYLENGRSKAPTIRELSIHKNTLNYRLQRIEEITGGLDLDDNNTAIAVLLGMKILGDDVGIRPSESQRRISPSENLGPSEALSLPLR